MLKRLILGLSFVLSVGAAPAAATDITAMNAGETDAFRAAVRAYLLENPEVLLEAIAILEQRETAAQDVNDSALVQVNAEALFNDGYSYVDGNPNGDLTIVEFVDYRCGYCRQAFPEVKELIESDGNIRLVLKEFPILGDDSILASRFAISTQVLFGDEAYGRVHDAMMTMRANVSEAALAGLADSLGLDGDAILAGMENPAVNQVISANHALAQRMAISGTPSFVVGDQMLRGYLPLAAMRSVVAEVRAASDG